MVESIGCAAGLLGVTLTEDDAVSWLILRLSGVTLLTDRVLLL